MPDLAGKCIALAARFGAGQSNGPGRQNIGLTAREKQISALIVAGRSNAEIALELGVRVSRTDDSAMAQGDFALMGEGRLKLTYIPQNAQLVTGDQVTTSGLGDKYPGGLLVGKIESIQTEADGISRTGVLLPSADVENIRYAYVITSFEG